MRARSLLQADKGLIIPGIVSSYRMGTDASGNVIDVNGLAQLRDLNDSTHPTLYDFCAGKTAGALGTASTGQTWSALGTNTPAYVQGLFTKALTYGTNPPTGTVEFLASVDIGGVAVAGGGTFRFRDSNPATTAGNVIIGSWDGTTSNVPVHIVMTQYAYYLSYVSAGVQTAVNCDLHGTAPHAWTCDSLKADGLTTYEVWWILDISNSKLYVGLPDGSIVSASDSHFASISGSATKVLFEGQITASTDAITEWTEVWGSTTIPKNLGMLGNGVQNSSPWPTAMKSNPQSGNYTFTIADCGCVVECTSASATNFTIPTDATVAWPVGTVIEVHQYGAGQVTIVAAAGVTLRSDGSKVKTAGQYASIGLRKRAANEWVLSGDLA